MPMVAKNLELDSSDILFAQLLIHNWQTKKSGCLLVRKGPIKKSIHFKKGEIIIGKKTFDGKQFLKTLTRKKSLDSAVQKEIKLIAEKKQKAWIKALIELEGFSPTLVWNLMEDYSKSDLFPLFDWYPFKHSFDSEQLPQEFEILFQIPALDLILEGIRQMKNNDLIQAQIPPVEMDIQILSPSYLNQIHLESPEGYLLHLIASQKKLKNVYDLSELGRDESQKIIYGFICLGIAGPPPEKNQGSSTQEIFLTDLNKIHKIFNKKCSCIFKYISKEIGPVALNVLEKCIEEITPYLSPSMQSIGLDTEGKIRPATPRKINLGCSNIKDKQSLLRDWNEILAAEILAVKKTLGNDHESILVKSLERIG